MEDLALARHDFDVEKQKLKAFSEKNPADLDLRKVGEGKGVGEWFGEWLLGGGIGLEHKVTGKELNALTDALQNNFISTNNTLRKLFEEFGQVYKTFDTLDRDYINAIAATVKSVEETSNAVKVEQEHNKQLVDNQERVIKLLKQFKDKIDSYVHLEDIDRIWSDCLKWHDEIAALTSKINATTSTNGENAKRIEALREAYTQIDGKVTELDTCLSDQITRLDAAIHSLSLIEGITHLHDVDEMWESLANAHTAIRECCEALHYTKDVVSEQQKTVENLVHFVEVLSQQEHLQDIDKMWDKAEAHDVAVDDIRQQYANTAEAVKKNQAEIAALIVYKEKLSGYEHIEDVDALWNSDQLHDAQIEELQEEKEHIKSLIKASNNSLATVDESAKTAIEKLNKRITYAFIIAGGSFALALVEMVMLLMR